MYKRSNAGIPTPTANLTINKSRMKLYGKNAKVPTYYLQRGQEFQIELFNPTKQTVLAKIILNGNAITQGGLVLKPGKRVFLDRYIDVPNKFKFDTYEVSNTAEVRKAIEDNGDFRVQFFNELPKPAYVEPAYVEPYYPHLLWTNSGGIGGQSVGGNAELNSLRSMGSPTTNVNYTNTVSGNINLTGMNDAKAVVNASVGGEAIMDSLNMNLMDQTLERKFAPEPKKNLKSKRSKKSIETGRVEEGSRSSQTLTTVYMNWESYPFHTVDYKMLPESQKVNTVESISTNRYCSNCGTKYGKTHRFCNQCGDKL